MSRHVASCHVMSGHVMSCHVMSCHVMRWFLFLFLHPVSFRAVLLAPAPDQSLHKRVRCQGIKMTGMIEPSIGLQRFTLRVLSTWVWAATPQAAKQRTCSREQFPNKNLAQTRCTYRRQLSGFQAAACTTLTSCCPSASAISCKPF